MFLSGQEGFQKFARGLIYVFIAIFPFLLYRGFLFNGTSTRAWNLILIIEILVIALAFVLFRKESKLSIPKSPITVSLFALFLSFVVSSLLGADFAVSFWSKVTRMSGLYYFLHLGVFYLFITMLFRRSDHLRTFIRVFTVSAALFSIASLLGKDGFGLIFANREWAGFTFGNSTFAAMYLFAAFILSLFHVVSAEKTQRLWWHYALPVACILNPYFINADIWRGTVNVFEHPLAVVGNAQTSSYTLVFSVLFLLFVWGISKIKSVSVRRNVIWGVTGVGVLAFVFFIQSFLSPSGFFQKLYLQQAPEARPIVWSLSKEAISERPVFGYGIDNFDRAFEAHYDNQIMERTKGGEAWFDRAHNIFIDGAIETGYVGVIVYILVYLATIGSMLYVIQKSKERSNQLFAVFILTYFVGHLIELQTAFDTTISYIPLVIMAGFAALLFHRTYTERIGTSSEWQISNTLQYMMGGVCIALFGTLFFVGTVPIFRAQIANGEIRTAGSSEKRMDIYPPLFNSPVDPAGFLHRTYNDLKRGISLTPELLENPQKVEGFKQELALLVEGYEQYIALHPDNYRARINLTELYIYQRLYNVNNLPKAHESADMAIALAPQIPHAYWEKAVAYLYERKFPEAREWAKKAYDLNPNIEESQRLVDYIERSVKTFPEIDLYNFAML